MIEKSSKPPFAIASSFCSSRPRCAFSAFSDAQHANRCDSGLSENQVIVFTDWMGARRDRRAGDVSASRKLQGLPASRRCVRRRVQLLDDHAHLPFQRRFLLRSPTRTEKLGQSSSFSRRRRSASAPDTTRLGQIFFHRRVQSHEPARRRETVDARKFLSCRNQRSAGVADVATVGGMPLEYQIDVPNRCALTTSRSANFTPR